MITQTYNLNMIPGGVPVRVPCSQRDDDSRTVIFNLYNASEPFAPSNASARVDGTRPDGGTFSVAVSLVGSTATWTIPLNATAAAGECVAELIVVSNGAVLGSANFRIDVEVYARDPDTPVTPEETSLWESMYDQTAALVGTATDAASSAVSSASQASSSATAAASSASSAATAAQAIVTNADAAPTSGSTNVVQSGGVYDAIQAATPVYDTTPTEGSTHVVTSGGVFNALTRAAVLWENESPSAAFPVQTVEISDDTLSDYAVILVEFRVWSTDAALSVMPIYKSSGVETYRLHSVTPGYSNYRDVDVDWAEGTFAFTAGKYTTISSGAQSTNSSSAIPERIIGIKF